MHQDRDHDHADAADSAEATTPLHERTATELAQQLRAGELSSVALTAHLLERIAARNEAARAFLTLTPERALERATWADAELARDAEAARADSGIARGRGVDVGAALRRRRPLLGLPFGDKDLTDRAGVASSYGSRAMAGFVPEVSARLALDLDAAGGVSLGKTNTPEFGFPCYTENGLGAPARNPWDPERGPGGSSGGAAVAVAARLLPLAPGSDGGGSVRIPAAACGLVGLKPSRGRVPGGSGVDALAGLPVAGPLARTTADAALLLDAMLVTADDWPHTLSVSRTGGTAPARSYAEDLAMRAFEWPPDAAGGLERLRVGVSTWSPWAERYDLAVEDAQLRALEATAGELEAAGHEVVRLPGGIADSSAHGVRAFDATREGVVDGTGFASAFRAVWRGGAAALPLDGPRLELVEPLTSWLVRTGRDLPVAELSRGIAYLADFERRVIAAYRGFDAVLTPALAMSPRKIGWFDPDDGEHNFAQQVQYTPFTSYVNATGLPAITMPVMSEAAPDGTRLPVGVQAIGRPGREDVLLRLSAWLEARRAWGARRPPID
ncbi:amidase [Pseudoclavibacter endophyticus]|uniref:Amidase n=1 Tax=Pseudoclavibacter endophyticus TaxID=1778590 RepID=A0A6H9WUK8_9MICO|nr:amidase [Pseudoclavibacter endophyticus]KAB1649870.1 amidase [Pseudoclavibacter endophyticus]GGA59143.1 amidase [Pseudoclavibacter endophyticus]